MYINAPSSARTFYMSHAVYGTLDHLTSALSEMEKFNTTSDQEFLRLISSLQSFTKSFEQASDKWHDHNV